MALIQSIWLPRRGKRSTMMGTKKTQVLAKGEYFTEYPDSGVGTGHGKVKMGDGVTDYEHLPYFLGDTENEKIAFTSNTSTTVAAALNAVVSGATLKNLIAGLKQAIVKCDANVTKLNDDLKASFQNGCNTICRHITSLGVNTPDNSAVSVITNNITALCNLKYNQGISDADARVNTISASYTAGYNTGYTAGETDGINKVKANPNAYGINTGAGVSAAILRITEGSNITDNVGDDGIIETIYTNGTFTKTYTNNTGNKMGLIVQSNQEIGSCAYGSGNTSCACRGWFVGIRKFDNSKVKMISTNNLFASNQYDNWKAGYNWTGSNNYDQIFLPPNASYDNATTYIGTRADIEANYAYFQMECHRDLKNWLKLMRTIAKFELEPGGSVTYYVRNINLHSYAKGVHTLIASMF